MMTIIQQPETFSFSSALKDIIIESDVNVTLVFSNGSSNFLQETYTPDNENRIYVRDLSRLLVPYISKTELRQRFLISVTPATGAGSIIDITVQYGLVEINVSASEFLASHFLTILPGGKVIFPNQKEYLSLVVTEPTQVTITAQYQSQARQTKTLQVTTLNKVVTVDVSPSLFPDPETIFFIVVSAGTRSFLYYIRQLQVVDPVQFIFLNSFGVKETFIPAGLTLCENIYQNLFGSFYGLYRKHNVELVKQHTTNTGVLTQEMAPWLEELFLSKDVFRFSPIGIEQEITIEEATVKRSSAKDELPAFEFKYRLSKRNHHELYTSADNLSNRIFDQTHDLAFN